MAKITPETAASLLSTYALGSIFPACRYALGKCMCTQPNLQGNVLAFLCIRMNGFEHPALCACFEQIASSLTADLVLCNCSVCLKYKIAKPAVPSPTPKARASSTMLSVSFGTRRKAETTLMWPRFFLS